jgi:nucleoredoxin
MVMTCEFSKWRSFDEDKRVVQRELEAKVASLPASVTIANHPHPLVKKASVYRGNYRCSVCSEGGSGWVYHCAECSFDAHPRCACPAEFAT